MAGNIFRLSSKSSSGTAQHLQTETITDSATKAARGGKHRKTEAWKEDEDTMKCSVDVSSFMRPHMPVTQRIAKTSDLSTPGKWVATASRHWSNDPYPPDAPHSLETCPQSKALRRLYADVRTGHQNICISQNLGVGQTIPNLPLSWMETNNWFPEYHRLDWSRIF